MWCLQYCSLCANLYDLIDFRQAHFFTAVPGQPSVGVDSTAVTPTSIFLFWSVPSDSVVDSYEVMWTSDECPDDVDEGSTTTSETSYIIEGLREGTRYTITVSATNSAGTSPSDSVTAETEELGNSFNDIMKIIIPVFSPIVCLVSCYLQLTVCPNSFSIE